VTGSLDTFYIQALLNPRDRQYHQKAKDLWPKLNAAAEVWVTEAVLVEIGNALSKIDRTVAGEFIAGIYDKPDNNLRLVSVDRSLMKRSLTLYSTRRDKTWGFTDCISFVVMQDQKLNQALTGDKDFVQAGFVALLAD
jgi:uncharacterized protein